MLTIPHVARIGPQTMSEQFFYVELKFIPKIVTIAEAILRQREVVVEVPKDLLHGKQSELLDGNATALDLARRAALGTFPTLPERVVGLYDEESPIWFEERHQVMNDRPCDYEENGTRAWKIA
jgi:hypothetical protein